MKPKFTQKSWQMVLGLVVILSVIISCNKDFDDINMPDYTPTFAIPLLQTSLTMNDVIEPGENIVYDQDGLIHFIYTDDNVSTIQVEDIVDIPPQLDFQKSYEMTTVVLLGDETQKLFDEDLNYDLTVHVGYELMEATLKNSAMSYTITSNIDETMRVVMEFPNTIDPATSSPVVASIDITNTGSPVTGSIDFSGTTTILDNPNQLPVNYEIWIIEDGSPLALNAGDELTIDLSLGTLDYSMLKGKFGKTTYPVAADQMDFDVEFFDEIDGDINFANPELTLTYKNSIGLPIAAVLNLEGNDLNGSTQDLNYLSSPGNDTIYFQSPTVIGSTYNGELVFNETNSDIGDLLALPPKQINYEGNATTNTFGTSTDNFVTDSSKIVLGFEMDIPVSFKASNITFQDTLDVDMEDNFSEDVDYADMTAIVENGFPFELDLTIVLVDQANNQIDDLTFSQTVASAVVNGDGEITSSTTTELSVRLDNQFLANLEIAKEAYVVANASTYNNGQQAVKLYSTYEIKIAIGLLAKLNVKDED